ncbi:MAG: chorismate mutase [Gemmatimonadaceae bacterium]|nr:chorismate mutase [Gloeobacterales cyanobacterium ES-bin-141]
MGWCIRGIRGATTVDANTEAAIDAAVAELLTTLCERNPFAPEDICSVIFSTTPDLNAMFPSQAARKHLSRWENVALLDLNQMQTATGITHCVRVLVQVNTPVAPDQIHHVYLRGARQLRPDRI